MMIKVFEQLGYNRKGFIDYISDDQKERLSAIKEIDSKCVRKEVERKRSKQLCFCVDYDVEKQKYHFETSYFVGVDWIIEGVQSIYVQPKLNKNDLEIDYLGMLFEALQEPRNIGHLDGLYEVDFDSPVITIPQQEDILTPFLIVEYLSLLHQIVRKGLKKDYYKVTRNLEAKVKGKILVGKTISKNLLRGNSTRTFCQYHEFGIDSEENRILKKGLQLAKRLLQQFNIGQGSKLEPTIRFITPAFEKVSDDIDIRSIKQFKLNPIYKEYERALRIAQLLFKKQGYNVSDRATENVTTPPFWIDMSKLFELYVFKKLREVFTANKEIKYHIKNDYQELDFLINSPNKGLKAVVDAKYKPRYHDKRIITSDIRQLSGYARMKKIYEKLEITSSELIDCIIIFSSQEDNYSESFDASDFIFEEGDQCEGYLQFYKIGISLPTIKLD